MATRAELLDAVLAQIVDYRVGEIAPMSVEHIDKWARQFPDGTQDGILAELAHVFSKTYFNRQNVVDFVSAIAINENLTGANPKDFWKSVKILQLQTAGNSQKDMLTIFDGVLKSKFGLEIADCGSDAPGTFLYIDDVLFSGGRIKHDIVKWIREAAPQHAKLEIVIIAYHALGQWRIAKEIAEAAKEAGKTIALRWWRVFVVEDRKAYMDKSDVLRPTAIPADPDTIAYVKGLSLQPVLRPPGHVGGLGFFSSDERRTLLEQQFLVSGVGVRKISPYLNDYMRPLGNSTMGTTGFGSTIVTYRNCPNNAPLVFWAGNPWYPLFPRKTN